MTKFFRENKKMLLLFLTIAIIFPIIILLPSPIGIIPYETGLTIIGYGGSILGGFLTLYGVWWTIEDNNKQREENQRQHNQERKENLANQYKPYISLIPQKNLQNEGINIKDCVKYDQINKKYLFEIVYKNIGRGNAKNLKIEIYSGNINIYDSNKKGYADVFPDNLLHRLQFSTNDDFIDDKATRKFKVIFSYEDGFSFYQYEMHYYIQYVTQNKQIISYSISLDHQFCKSLKIKKQKSKNESEE